MASPVKIPSAKDIRTYSPSGCPLHGFFSLLSGPWTLYILWLLVSNGPTRFGALKKQIPSISAKMLTQRLRMLEEAALVTRTQEATIPPKVTYALSARGKELQAVLKQIDALAQSWMVEVPAPVRRKRAG